MRGSWIVPDWPAPPTVHALSTTRAGGFSRGPYRSFNLGDRTGDDPETVARNRTVLEARVPGPIPWLRQVHGTNVVDRDRAHVPLPAPPPAEADAARTALALNVCAVLTADCLPVLLCDRQGTEVAAVHAGWRGLAAGVLERTVAAMRSPPRSLLAWLGPAISGEAYEVGEDVRDAFAAEEAAGAGAFTRVGSRWHFDLVTMARHRLKEAGVTELSGGHWCTYRDADRFFSYRRDGRCGRMATLVWLGG